MRICVYKCNCEYSVNIKVSMNMNVNMNKYIPKYVDMNMSVNMNIIISKCECKYEQKCKYKSLEARYFLLKICELP